MFFRDVSGTPLGGTPTKAKEHAEPPLTDYIEAACLRQQSRPPSFGQEKKASVFRGDVLSDVSVSPSGGTPTKARNSAKGWVG